MNLFKDIEALNVALKNKHMENDQFKMKVNKLETAI